MQVRTMGQGPHPDFSIAGGVVTVAGVAIDCAARQGDSQHVIDIRRESGSAQEGGGGYQLASIRIPPRQYVEVEEEAPGEGAPGTAREARPLDPHQVAVTVWPAV